MPSLTRPFCSAAQPNMTWLQPPGVVHAMVDQTWQPHALQVDVPPGAWGGQLRGAANSLCSAQKSADGKTLVLRYVNFHQSTPYPLAPATTLKVYLKGSMAEDAAFASATMWTLSSDDPLAANPPGQPRKIAPKKQALPSFGDGTVLQLPANSYTVVVARLA